MLFGDSAKVKIGEWETDDVLSFKAKNYNFVTGNVGIGVYNPQYALDINGIIFLHTVDDGSRWLRSYLYYGGHSLVVGSPVGLHTNNSLDLFPGGEDVNTDTLTSQIRMYNAINSTIHEEMIHINTNDHCWFKNNGNIGIGTWSPQYKLDVLGSIHASEIIVDATGADYVFDNNYNLPSLKEIEYYINENKHLPDIPSATEMEQNGVSLNKLTIILLQEIEELTMYTIQQEKRIQELEQQLNK